MSERGIGSSLYLLTGFAIGLIAGLLFAWLILPVRYVDTSPSSLNATGKDEYRRVIALAYRANHDMGRTVSRLALLGDAHSAWELASQAQRILKSGGSQQEAKVLAELAALVGQPGVAVNIPSAVGPQTVSATPEGNQVEQTPIATNEAIDPIRSPTPLPSRTWTPIATFTPRPRQPTSTVGPPFAREGQIRTICENDLPAGLLQVEIYDGSGKPVPGVRVEVTWQGGTDNFYTGLYPEINDGYADFVMTPEVIYSLRVGEGGEVVSGLTVPQCPGGEGSKFAGGLWIKFSQP
jgi:hypothetical protein